MSTRGIRHLKEYIGEAPVRAKRAQDVVPVLSRKDPAALRPDAQSLSAHVRTYLQERSATGATNRLSTSQMRAAQALAGVTHTAGTEGDTRHVDEQVFMVKRLEVAALANIVDTVAIGALERHERFGSTSEGSYVFVLTEDADTVERVCEGLRERYGLMALALPDDGHRFPTFPVDSHKAARPHHQPARGRTPPPRSSRKQSQPPPKESEESMDVLPDNAALPAASVVVVVASPKGFLAVDRRSAIWKFVGAYVIASVYPVGRSPLLKQLTAGAEECAQVALAEHRWGCLGHTSLACIMTLSKELLVAPQWEWLTLLQPSAEAVTSEVPQGPPPGKPVPTQRAEVRVHYAVAAGVARFQFLFALLQGLASHSGLVVHCATREVCAFLYDTLYNFLEDVPPHVRLMTDYESESPYAVVQSSADRQRLCEQFDAVIEGQQGSGSGSAHTAAVLLSCHGLAPLKGTVFLQYDVIVDLPNYCQFICDTLTPGAYVDDTDGAVQRVTHLQHRARGRSPLPVPTKKSRTGAETVALTPPVSAPAMPSYRHIILLFRPNEVKGALRHLGLLAKRHNLTVVPLPKPPSSTRYLHVGKKLISMNKKLFAIQNAAYHAYKATMRVYCTIGPRDTYDETVVNLESVAEEFGYTELPLLDLRLRDTPFRPKEDYFKAAKQKQMKEFRSYKRFADANIIGEAPEPHVTDEQD